MKGKPLLEVLSWIAGISSFILALYLAWPYLRIGNIGGSRSEKELLNQGKFYLDKGNIDSAIYWLDRFVIAKPDEEEGFYYRGKAYRVKGADTIAMQNYSEAIRLNPSYNPALLERANIYFYKKEYGSSLKDLDEIFSSEPGNVDALNLRGLIQINRSEFDEAQKMFSKAVELDPTNPILHYNLGISRTNKVRRIQYGSILLFALSHEIDYPFLYLFDSVITHFDKAISYKSDFPRAFYARGVVKLGQISLNHTYSLLDSTATVSYYKSAIADFNEAIRLDSIYPEAYFFRGLAKLSIHHDSDAGEDIQKAKSQGLLIDMEQYKLRNLSHSQVDYLSEFFHLVKVK